MITGMPTIRERGGWFLLSSLLVLGRRADAAHRHPGRDSRPGLLPGGADATGVRPSRVESRFDAVRRDRVTDDVRHPRSFRHRRLARRTCSLWRCLVNVLAHRGPDDSTFWHAGRFTFGHRRLSIIELSSAGRQPMATDDGELVVTFNGEIYNYIELRDELTAHGHRFRTRSDTEVLLHGYRQWGTDLPARLRGMFAFAIADRRRQELFAVRDRFGEKPLFYRETPTGPAFASEVKVLAALPGLERGAG